MDGVVIHGSRCPRCGSAMAYGGNYWCTVCPWVLPEHPSCREKDAFNIAYALYMQQTDREPNSGDLL